MMVRPYSSGPSKQRLSAKRTPIAPPNVMVSPSCVSMYRDVERSVLVAAADRVRERAGVTGDVQMRRETHDVVTRELLALPERKEHRAADRERDRVAVFPRDAQIQRGSDVARALLVHGRQELDAVARGRVTEGVQLHRAC